MMHDLESLTNPQAERHHGAPEFAQPIPRSSSRDVPLDAMAADRPPPTGKCSALLGPICCAAASSRQSQRRLSEA